MSFDAFLGKLDLDQLQSVVDKAQQLIDAKKREDRLVVWSLEDRYIRIKTFADADYVKAAELLLETAKENAASPQNLKAHDKELHLVPLFICASEYHEWVG